MLLRGMKNLILSNGNYVFASVWVYFLILGNDDSSIYIFLYGFFKPPHVFWGKTTENFKKASLRLGFILLEATLGMTFWVI